MASFTGKSNLWPSYFFILSTWLFSIISPTFLVEERGNIPAALLHTDRFLSFILPPDIQDPCWSELHLIKLFYLLKPSNTSTINHLINSLYICSCLPGFTTFTCGTTVAPWMQRKPSVTCEMPRSPMLLKTHACMYVFYCDAFKKSMDGWLIWHNSIWQFKTWSLPTSPTNVLLNVIE